MTEETAEQKALREEQERMDQEDTGTGGKAKDGEPNGVTDLHGERAKRRGQTAAQMSTGGGDEPVQSEDSDGQQAWEPEPGKRVSLGSLIAKGKPVEYKTTVQGTGVKLKGGINDPASEQVAVSRLYVEGYNVRYTRDSDGHIEKTTVTEIKVPRTIDPAKSESGQLVLANMGDAQEAAAG
jgi:hypothetical protein